MLPCRLLSFALITAASAFVRPALALSCAPASVVAPAPDASNVPTNTRIWCGNELGGNPLSLSDPEGEAVSGTSSLITTVEFELGVFEPDEELRPNTTYSVECGYSSHSFTTGSARLDSAPPVPDPTNWSAHAYEDSTWGDTFYITFEGASAKGTLVVVDLEGSANLNPDAPSGSVTQAVLPPEFIALGRGPCVGGWEGAGLRAKADVALGAFDVAGNFSGWSEPVEVAFPGRYTNQGGCQFAPGGAPVPFAMLSGFFWIGIWRRRVARTRRAP